MVAFALVHGGGHRGHHWNALRAELDLRGHRTVAPDLPMEDEHLGLEDWSDIVRDELMSFDDDDDVVLVGHSLAGLVLPVVASRTKISLMIFLCALVPTPGIAWSSYVATQTDASSMPWDRVPIDRRGRMCWPWELAREVFYPDCTPEDAAEAYRSTLPVAATALDEPTPIDRWPDVPSAYILCRDDRVIGQSWSRRISINELGGRALEIPGGHSPMLSRPHDLAVVLESVVAKQT